MLFNTHYLNGGYKNKKNISIRHYVYQVILMAIILIAIKILANKGTVACPTWINPHKSSTFVHVEMGCKHVDFLERFLGILDISISKLLICCFAHSSLGAFCWKL
ncbi:hypothetical protein [Dysgonomonas sp. 521]|uniref:hypothetical protein n=1 Tax=Dysgonomonas sp. 521 TaxID=2302932 RepID=UPI0013D5D342|nr:hypothetical protein [Dysgonomonas sp. 521]